MSANQELYNFVLMLSGVSEPDGELEDALFEAGCDDATLAFRNRAGCLEFDGVAPSVDEAILSALCSLERADPRLTMVSVEPEIPSTLSKSPGEPR